MKLGVKNVTVINPGCNYPIPINEEAKEFAKKNIWKCFTEVNYNFKIRWKKKSSKCHDDC